MNGAEFLCLGSFTSELGVQTTFRGRIGVLGCKYGFLPWPVLLTSFSVDGDTVTDFAQGMHGVCSLIALPRAVALASVVFSPPYDFILLARADLCPPHSSCSDCLLSYMPVLYDNSDCFCLSRPVLAER